MASERRPLTVDVIKAFARLLEDREFAEAVVRDADGALAELSSNRSSGTVWRAAPQTSRAPQRLRAPK